MKEPRYYGIVISVILVLTILSVNGIAVTSKITRHSTQAEFTEGEIARTGGIPVAVGILASNREIYSVGIGCSFCVL